MNQASHAWPTGFEAFERLGALSLLLLVSPLLLLIAVAVVLEDGTPVLFRQWRVGRFGRRFEILKFRTMRSSAHGPAVTASNDSRITRTGRILRRFKLDEIPQLWNVVRGDMRLIGPRPEVPQYVDPADPAWRTVLAVKPGITDLATLMFRDEETILAGASHPEQFYRSVVLPKKLALNCEYLAAKSAITDLRLLLYTVCYSLQPRKFDAIRVRSLVLGGRTA
jgi:lipopolysaccharide/colanic/teichoic acid biosynthesis glycosyltransferase